MEPGRVVLTPAPLQAPELPPEFRLPHLPSRHLTSMACVPSSGLTLGRQGDSGRPLVWKVPQGPSEGEG